MHEVKCHLGGFSEHKNMAMNGHGVSKGMRIVGFRL